jgi:5'-3' exonuclease
MINNHNVNVIIDGNYLFHRCIGVIDWALFKDPDFLVFQDKKTRDVLKKALYKQFISFFKNHEDKLTYRRIIFVSDARSWRYDIYPEYKAGRAKSRDPNLDYSELSSIIEEFVAELPDCIIKSNIPKLEGDDEIYLYGNYIYNVLNENVVILASDVDLTQLVKTNLSKEKYIAHYNINGDGKVTVTNDFEEYVKSIVVPPFNIFEVSDTTNNKFVNSIVNNDTTVYINPIEIVIDKLIGVDTSDNIKNLWTGLGKKTIERFMTQLNERNFDYHKLIKNLMTFEDKYYIEFIEMLNDFCKVTRYARTYKMDISEIVTHLKMDLRLVYISHEFYPRDSLKIFSRLIKGNILDNINPKLDLNEKVDVNVSTHNMFKSISKIEELRNSTSNEPYTN